MARDALWLAMQRERLILAAAAERGQAAGGAQGPTAERSHATGADTRTGPGARTGTDTGPGAENTDGLPADALEALNEATRDTGSDPGPYEGQEPYDGREPGDGTGATGDDGTPAGAGQPPLTPGADPTATGATDTAAALGPPVTTRADRMESLLVELGRKLALDRSRAVEKAMLPLKRLVDSPHDLVLDEEATAEAAAEQGLWLLLQRPRKERWLTLTLVVDTGESMRLWAPTAERLQETLYGSGAFRDVPLTTWPADGRLPCRGNDRDGRHVLLVLTDLQAPRWSDGSAHRALAHWARDLPVAVAHVLPEHVWARTGTQAGRVRLSSPRPAAPNADWDVTHDELALAFEDLALEPSLEDPATAPAAGGGGEGGRADGARGAGVTADAGVAVPVVTLSPEGLGGWARFTAGEQPGEWATRALHVSPTVTAAGPVPRPEPARHAAPDAQARALRAQVSPTAYRLARMCAALPLLNLAVLQMVQARLLPEARTWHVAELLLSGLLRRVPADPEAPSLVRAELELGNDLRRELLSDGTKAETARAMTVTFDYLATAVQGPMGYTFGQLGGIVRDPTRVSRLPVEALQPWVSSILPAFAAMAGPYAVALKELKHRLSAAAETPGAPPPSVPDDATSDGDTPLAPGAAEVPQSEEEGNAEVSGLQSAEVGPRSDGLQKPPPVWGNVPPRNRAFTGRVQLLQDLHRRLQEGTTAVLPEALQGMGGVGKSQLAVEYVYRHLHEYQVIWWIPSEQPQQIRQFLVMLAGRLGLNVGNGEANSAVPAVIEALRVGEPYKNWLLVFDNAENPEAVREFFPTNGPGRILVTSRNAQWAASARPLEVDVFTREESRALLQLRAPTLDDETADRLAETLGDLPLGIEQAAVWLSETGMPAEEYLRLFEQQANELMNSDPPADYPLTVAAAWNVSLERLRRNHPAALQLLQVCAFFAPEPISRRLLSGVRDAPVPAELSAALSDPIKLSRAIREINRYALARINHNTNTIQLHRLVQRVLINQMSEPLKRQMREGAHRLLAKGDPGEPEASHQWQQYGDLLPHVLHSGAVRSTDPWVRQLVLNEVAYMFAWGDHQGCADLAKLAYDTWRGQDGADAEHVFAAAKPYADALRILGRYSEAYELDQRTLAGMSEVLGSEHESTLEVTSMLAWDLRLRGDFSRALELDKHVFDTCTRLFGPNDVTTLVAAHRHALNLRYIGAFQEALDLDRETYRRRVEEFGENHLSTLSTMAAVALDLQEGGQYLAARDQARDVADRYQYNYGHAHPHTMAALRLQSVTERRAGNHARALELSGQALGLFRTRYGDKYPLTVSTLVAHAIDVRQSGDLTEALRLGQEGYEGFEVLLGHDHPHTVAGRVNHAICLRLAGHVEEAHAIDTEARDRLVEALGEDHPNALACSSNLAVDLYELGEVQQSVDVARRALEQGRARFGSGVDHPVVLATALNLALGLRQLGQSEEAEELYADTLGRYRTALGEDHPACRAAEDGRSANCDIDPLQI
ncbi:FxSxx-COOH system tetratricopeptide repeat protein [Streptomyces naganishii]|uniref:FxSxx-COOH system tetratricopeptide repeat protein n=1 Tax=Streptomyces naganishii TaxID=285447 RepID=UPI00367722DC